MMTSQRFVRSALAWALGLCVALLPAAARSDEVVVPGSGNPEQVLRVLADAFHRSQPAHRVVIPGSTGTAGALRAIQEGTAVLGRIGRPLTDDERSRGLVFVPIGRDPVAFVGGAGVGLRGLTRAQVVDIYAGKYANWQELGGRPGPIRAIGREPTDTSRQSIQRVIEPFSTIVFGEHVKVVHLDPQMLDLLDRFPGSLGFINRSALAAARTRLVPLALDGVEPSPQNVGAGRYPLWLEFGFVHRRGLRSPAAEAFVAYVRSSEGVRLLREMGVLAAPGSP
ncbi:substrate-binding domain-containing protein [Ideonella sp. A 288]|uniref:substrate-binding domain-containing protein n=1 Tax=Ideonella sp. A 288 TaxID=1962181 RepID=UPI001303CC63|nr:substrate-binding domain-containing protein [Ideonella sp. A 288]